MGRTLPTRGLATVLEGQIDTDFADRHGWRFGACAGTAKEIRIKSGNPDAAVIRLQVAQ